MKFEKTINLDVTGEYEDFTDFYNSNIEKIYNEIIECNYSNNRKKIKLNFNK